MVAGASQKVGLRSDQLLQQLTDAMDSNENGKIETWPFLYDRHLIFVKALAKIRSWNGTRTQVFVHPCGRIGVMNSSQTCILRSWTSL